MHLTLHCAECKEPLEVDGLSTGKNHLDVYITHTCQQEESNPGHFDHNKENEPEKAWPQLDWRSGFVEGALAAQPPVVMAHRSEMIRAAWQKEAQRRWEKMQEEEAAPPTCVCVGEMADPDCPCGKKE